MAGKAGRIIGRTLRYLTATLSLSILLYVVFALLFSTEEEQRLEHENALYKELYQHEPNKAVRKRYMNATLAYYNGLAFGKGTWWHFATNAKLYFEALHHISDAKDLVFCLGGLVPTAVVKWVMKTFKV